MRTTRWRYSGDDTSETWGGGSSLVYWFTRSARRFDGNDGNEGGGVPPDDRQPRPTVSFGTTVVCVPAEDVSVGVLPFVSPIL
jgi:hypothetical protein